MTNGWENTSVIASGKAQLVNREGGRLTFRNRAKDGEGGWMSENCCENDASIDVDFLIEYDERRVSRQSRADYAPSIPCLPIFIA
jgi:hypothetical protein